MPKSINLSTNNTHVVVIGASAGGIPVIQTILSGLPNDFKTPIIIVIHRLKNTNSGLASVFESHTKIPIKEADDKEYLKANTIYIAPANYHLLMEEDKRISLSYSEMVNYSRPAIDISFDCIADVYEYNTIGVLLTGANKDGALGLQKIESKGGKVIVQDPSEAAFKVMPQAGIDSCKNPKILLTKQITPYLLSL